MWYGKSEKNFQKVFTHAAMYVKGEIDISAEGEVTRFDPDRWAEEREAELLDEVVEEEEALGEPAPGEQNRARRRRGRRASEVRDQVREELANREDDDNNEERYAIIFFDEIDALGASRDNTPFQGGVSNRIVSGLLENMDGLE